MEAEVIVLLVGAIAGIIAFSVALGFWTAQLGYRFGELRERLETFDARYQTPVGRRARIPRLVTNVRNPLQHFGRILLPVGVNGALLALLFASGTHLFILTPLYFVVGALEWFVIWCIQKRRRVGYEAEFQEFMRLTADGNRMGLLWLFEGDALLSMSDAAVLRINQIGRIISASLGHPALASEVLRLLCPKDLDVPPEAVLVSRTVPTPLSRPHRVFYRKTGPIDGVLIDGILVGVQLSPAPFQMFISGDYKRRLA